MEAEPELAVPALVALPGTLCPPAVFEPLAAELDGEVTVDPVSWLTGPGPWDIPAVAARVARYIGARWGGPVLVCEHSTGGAIALQLAVTEPSAVAGLLLVNTGAHMKGHGDVGAILERVRASWGEELAAAVLDRSFHHPLDPVTRASYLRWATACNPQAVHDVLASQRELDLTSELAALTRPAIVVHGRYDQARPPDQGRELACALPEAEFRLAEAGHTPVYETPGFVAAAVRDLVARVAGPVTP
jgi:pimeloyl-ACP methyl ester carboxylesterase